MVDFYTKRNVVVRTTEELSEWLWDNTVTKSRHLSRTIEGLISALEAGEDYTYHALANGLEISKKRQTRRKTK